MMYEFFEHNQVKLYISKAHRFGTDSLLLGEFAGNVRSRVVCDLCSGCGIIPIMLAGAGAAKIYAVEIQPEAVALLRRTISENAQNVPSIEVVHADLRGSLGIPRESVDTVTANPPYFPQNSGFERESQRIARHENECTLADVVKAAAELLKFGGELKMSMTASRLAECIGIMQEYRIEPKVIHLVGKKSGEARLVLISGKKGAKSGVRIAWK
jgi:tRNA1(Val) A37 N6-methylase TrmN6